MRLDDLKLAEVRVGYGEIGLRGRLGYEGKSVRVGGRDYDNALSTHPPAHVGVDLGGRFREFRCAVAINGDVEPGRSHADFSVVADGRLVASARQVLAGQNPRVLNTGVAGTRLLELVVETTAWEHCHAVWLDPELGELGGRLTDCLGRTEIELGAVTRRAARCVATVVSPGFEGQGDDMLGSLAAHGGCEDALLVLFSVAKAQGPAVRRLAAKYGATLVPCVPIAPVNAQVKALMYSIALVVESDAFVLLDADTLVLGSLLPLFGAIEALPPGSVLAAREANTPMFRHLTHILTGVYGGRQGDLTRLTGDRQSSLGAYPLVVNDGVLAAGRAAMLALDRLVRSWPAAPAWCDERRDVTWRNQFVFNLALAHLDCGVEMDPTYNVQLNYQEAELSATGGRLRATWQGRPVRVLHFNGLGRVKYAGHRGLFAAVRDPLPRPPEPGALAGYDAFVTALRAWVARAGLGALAWSFYGTADAQGARVADAGTFPLFAALYHLVRAQGCRRVLETGTCRGVSAACLACAVADREGARVVTLDISVFPGRDDLWGLLPEPARAAIDFRQVDSLAGLHAAAEAGETFELALLDSLHDGEHVWAEFELARRVVCRGGLILVHDARLALGTVPEAFARVEAAGFPVTRLWCAAHGVAEDDRLGLAVIENRV